MEANTWEKALDNLLQETAQYDASRDRNSMDGILSLRKPDPLCRIIGSIETISAKDFPTPKIAKMATFPPL